jgi:2-polyprenyl-6-hydroxyphenyl methylase/3-demethylubiquinone-9 3-methyltransferase
MTKVLSSDALWKEGGGYYKEDAGELRRKPILPDLRRLRDRRILGLFRRHGNLSRESHLLEIGCGRSIWLPHLAREFGCRIAGLDTEPLAAELAEANLAGAGVQGEIFCRDAFDLGGNRDLMGKFDLVYSMGVMEHFDDAAERLVRIADYLKHGGRILTLVPNLQGVNWLFQRLASLDRLRMHMIYDPKRLTQVHERAGFEILAAGYVGFYDGYITETYQDTGPSRRRIHGWLCWASSMFCEAWTRTFREGLAPEVGWIAPLVFYAGRRY